MGFNNKIVFKQETWGLNQQQLLLQKKTEIVSSPRAYQDQTGKTIGNWGFS